MKAVHIILINSSNNQFKIQNMANKEVLLQIKEVKNFRRKNHVLMRKGFGLKLFFVCMPVQRRQSKKCPAYFVKVSGTFSTG